MNGIMDMARISCVDNEIVFQLSKLLESICIATSFKGSMPLTSVTQYLLTSTNEQRDIYFKEIGHNRPYDLSYIRFMLLGK